MNITKDYSRWVNKIAKFEIALFVKFMPVCLKKMQPSHAIIWESKQSKINGKCITQLSSYKTPVINA